MDPNSLTAISPLDGRYAAKCQAVRSLFSEQGLIELRTLTEIRWLQFLAEWPQIEELPAFSPEAMQFLDDIIENFSSADGLRVKEIEKTTNHDVKAVEYFIAGVLDDHAELAAAKPFVHFGCTSEDINNISYALMLARARDQHILPQLQRLSASLRSISLLTAKMPMLARTHGQPASPTTLGKELANFIWRLERQMKLFAEIPVLAKINGAVGNYNAQIAAYPEVNWPELSCGFVESLGLDWNPYTTQIDPHDWVAEYCDALARINSILLDASRDFWSYISIGTFRQKLKEGEIGSSTMPHKINPIDFENCEGNLGIANALLGHFSAKLPISRWQRDLSDSTVQRNLGVAITHSLLAWQSLLAGLAKLEPDELRLKAELEGSWEVLAEAIQTVMRRYGHTDAYEQLKALTRGADISEKEIRTFLDTLDIPADARERLKALTPASYTGLAIRLTMELAEQPPSY